MKTHCPIVPIALIDSFKPFDKKTTGHITVHIHILKPILWEYYHDMTTVEIAQIVKMQIAQKMNEILQKFSVTVEKGFNNVIDTFHVEAVTLTIKADEEKYHNTV